MGMCTSRCLFFLRVQRISALGFVFVLAVLLLVLSYHHFFAFLSPLPLNLTQVTPTLHLRKVSLTKWP
jgi:hypothetical protein